MRFVNRLALLFVLVSPLRLLAASPPGEVPYGYEAAKAAMGSMKPAEGLEVGLYAAEPQIVNPTNLDIDPRGRIWAVEAVNYRKWSNLRPEGDRVVILEDTQHTGVADKATTFWQNPELKGPLGICVLPQPKGTKVIVSCAPNVWLLTDADGDDHAEKAVKILTTGGNWNHDHQIHAFSFGMDGKFYFNMGNESKKLMDVHGKVIVDIHGHPIDGNGNPYRGGMVFRCDIDLESGAVSNVEALAWNFRNNYEVAVDSFGTLWQSDNDDDGNKAVRINYVMQHGNYGYSDEMTGASWQTQRTNMETEIPKRHWHQNDPGSIPNLLQTGSGSPTGILFNEGTLLGRQFENQMIHCDAGPRVVRAYPVTKDGAGYKASSVDVLTSSDQWYRPADLCIAPDGSLFIADWYDQVVGGHNMVDHDLNKMRGRLYRVAPPGAKYEAPALDLKTPEGAVAALKSPNRATQYVAWTALHGMGAQALPQLTAMAQGENPRLRARAMGLLANTPSVAIEALRRGLSDADSDVRVAAIRLCVTVPNLDVSPLREEHELVSHLLKDPSAQVRREIALALYDAKNVPELWARLAQQYDAQDRWYLEALGIGATGHDAECLDAWLRLNGGAEANWNTPAGRDIIWRLRTPKIAPFLVRILSGTEIKEAEAPRFVRAFDFIPASPEKTAALTRLVKLAETKKFVATEALERLKGTDLKANPELKNAVLELLPGSRGSAQFVELVRDFKLPDQGEGLLEIAEARPDSGEGVEAAKLLLSAANAPLVEQALAGPKAVEMVRALGNTADAQVVSRLQKLLLETTENAPVRQQAAKSLAKSPAGQEALLQLARDGKFPEDLRLVTTAALAAVQNQKNSDAISQLFPAPNAMGGKALPPIPELAKIPGNAAHGQELFLREQTSCITCHRVGEHGVDFGPALSEIGSKLGKEALFEAIINPNAGISMGFETTQLTLKDKSAAIGIMRSETADELVLATPGGIPVRYKKSEVVQRERLPNSMMPSGLNQALSQQDLVDIVEYLASLKAAPPKP